MIRKYTKKSLSLLLALIMMLSLLPAQVLAVEEDTHEHCEVCGEHECICDPTEVCATCGNEVCTCEEENSEVEQLGSELLVQVLGLAADYVEKFGLSADMTDMQMANQYFSFDSEMAQAAWEDYEAGYALAQGLSAAEAELLLADQNAQTAQRFYGILQQIYGVATVASSGPYTPVDGVTVTISGNVSSDSMSGGVITVNATGAKSGCDNVAGTVTLAIANTTDADVIVAFVAASDKSNSAAGSKTLNIGANSSGTLTINTSVTGTGNTEKFTFSSFSVTEVASDYNLTIKYDSSLGGVTVDGAAANANEAVSVSSNGATLVATANGSTFLGWTDANGKIVETGTTLSTNKLAGDTTYTAAFVSSSSTGTPWFGVGALEHKKSDGLFGFGAYDYYAVSSVTHLFDDLNNAADASANSSSKGVVLMNNGTLPAGDYTVHSGVTLLIPFDDANTLYTVNSGTGATSDSYTTPTAYRTLTLSSGANLIIEGEMSLSAKHRRGDSSGHPSGSPTGAVSFVRLAEGSTVTVENGGKLYAWGYISPTQTAINAAGTTGPAKAGQVIAKSGSTVYEMFQVRDYRGGSVTTEMGNDTEHGVFPLSQYYVQNIEVPLSIISGAKVCSYLTIYMRGSIFESSVDFIGPSGSMFNLTSGSAIKYYDGSTDRLMVEVNGDITVSSTKLKMDSSLEIDSANYELPINGNITLTAKTGTITVGQDVALLPGAKIVVEKGTTCTLGSSVNMYLYGANAWGGYCSEYNNIVLPVKYAPSQTCDVRTSVTDAQVVVKGTVDASAGYVYTTSAGVVGVVGEEGATIKTRPGAQTITYQVTQSSSSISAWNEIAIQPAVLKNGDGTCTETAQATDNSHGTYTYTNGRWICGVPGEAGDQHTYGEVETKAATCTEDGYTKKTCLACGYENITTLSKLGHDYENGGTVSVTATCTTDGYTTYTCQREGCEYSYEGDRTAAVGHNKINEKYTWEKTADGYSCVYKFQCANESNKEYSENGIVSYEEITAATCSSVGKGVYTATFEGEGTTQTYEVELEKVDHSYGEGVVTAPTCTEQGYTTHTCIVCGDSYKDAYVDAAGHTEVVDAAVDPTCTATGLTEGKHCSVCGTVLVAQTVTTALGHDYEGAVTTPATCTTAGVKTYTCSRCGDSYTEPIAKLGHDIVEHEGKAATCTEIGWDVYDTCSRCDYTTYVEIAAKGHTEVVDAAVDPTCTATGLTEGKHCSVCSAVLVAQTVVDALGHTEVIDAAVAPTCTATGLTEGEHCSVCNTVLIAQTVVAAKGHDYDYENASYGWSTDLSECTATAICKNNCGVPMTETVGTSWKITTAADCTEDGVKTFTAEFGNVNFMDQTKAEPIEANGHTLIHTPAKEETCTVDGNVEYWTCSVCGAMFLDEDSQNETTADAVVISKTGHDYALTGDFEWAVGNLTCTATAVCRNDCGIPATQTVHLDNEDITISKAATCLAEGDTTYTATFTADWIPDDQKVQMVVAEGNVAKDPQNHVKPGDFSYIDNEDGTHNKYYACCSALASEEPHTYTNGTCVCTAVQSITITWINGNSTKTTTETYGVVHTAPFTDEELVKAPDNEGHYAFAGWSTAADGAAAAPEAATANVTYYAVFTGEAHTKDPNDCTKCTDCEYVGVAEHKPNLPTCVTPAICEDCGMETESAMGHNYSYNAKDSRWVEAGEGYSFVVVASCNREGTCTATEEFTLTGVEVSRVAATCFKAGKVSYQAVSTTDENAPSWVKDIDVTNIKKDVELPILEHDLVATPEKAATCVEPGNYAYWTCSLCNTVYADAAATVITSAAAQVRPVTGEHTWGTGVETTSATCENAGVKTYTCTVDDCGETRTEEIPATNHNYEDGAVTYTWGDDNASCTAFRACTNTGCDSQEKVTVTSTSEVTTPATCETMGETTYTATFGVEWAETQTKTVADIDAKNHDWSVSYKWSTDGKSCTAIRTCANDAGHKVEVVGAISSEQTKDPTCLVKGETTYTASFDVDWATEQTNKVDDVSALDHDYGTPEYAFAEDGKSCTATHSCTRADCAENAEGHSETVSAVITAEVTTAPGCTTMGKTTYTATFGVDWAVTQYQTVEDVPAAHTWVHEDEKPATCTETGETSGSVCSVCNATQGVTTIAALGHDWTAWSSNGDNTHTHSCQREDCDKTVTEACTGGEATCTEQAVCEVCKTKYGNALQHNYSTEISCDWTYNADTKVWSCTATHVCLNDANHKETADATVSDVVKVQPGCTTMGTTTYTATFTETWAGTDTKDVEDIPATGHTYTAETAAETYLKSAATCDSKAVYYKSCAVCGASSEGTEKQATFLYGEIRAHDWSAWASTGNNTHTHSCNYADCGKTVTEACTGGEATCTEQAVCAVCETTYGRALDHNYSTEISYEWSFNEETGWSCTAKRVCTRDESHVDVAEGTITSAVSIPATCQVMGTTLYTASFEANWALTQTQTRQDIALADHIPDGGKITKSPFYATAGERTFYCTECKEACGTAIEPATGVINISVLGDSITAFKDYSNGAAADTANTTLAGGRVWFPMNMERGTDSEGNEITTEGEIQQAEQIWIYKAAQELGANVLVNNSWSGSAVLFYQYGAPGMWEDRCVQLHDNIGENSGQEPDIIVVYMGTNDFKHVEGVAGMPPLDADGNEINVTAETLGTYEAVDFDTLITANVDGSFTYREPETTMEAYAISFHKMQQRYPNSQLYVMNILPFKANKDQPTDFNQDIRQMAAHFGATLVDLENIGLMADAKSFEYLMEDWLHPNLKGMEMLSNAFVSAIRRNEDNSSLFGDYEDVSFTLDGVVSMEGTSRTALVGEAFAASLKLKDADLIMQVTVTMNGVDITEACCTKEEDTKLGGKIVKITIANVTGPIAITATAHKHTYSSVVTPPTCLVGGYTTYTCECGDSYTANETSAAGHSYTTRASGILVSQATCTSAAVYYVQCDNCDNVSEEKTVAVGDPLAHTYETNRPSGTMARPATCTLPALYYVQCDNCDVVNYSVTVNVGSSNGHTYGETTYHWSYDETEKKWTCTAKHICAVGTCTEAETGHTETETVTATGQQTQAPDCINMGVTTYTATFTVDWADQDTKVVDDIAANGHTYSETTYIWSEDGKTCTATHSCTVAGCDAAAAGHSESATAQVTGKQTQAPDCINMGVTTYTARFDVDWADQQTTTRTDVPALGHAEVAHEAKDATCTEIGWDAYVTCSRCDYTTYAEISALGHDEAEHEAKAATCTDIGWDAYVTCSRCDYTTYVEIAALGHDHEPVVTAPTCTEQGYTTYTCHCGDSYVADYVNARNHNYNPSVTAPTCEDEGYTTYTCSRCGDNYVADSVNAKGHSGTPTAKVDATCTEPGTKAYWTCNTCSEIFADADYTEKVDADAFDAWGVIPATGHQNVTAVDKVEAKCEESGLAAFWKCADCSTCFSAFVSNEEYTEIADFSVWSSETGEGYLAATGHRNVVKTEENPAKCLASGTKAYWTCEDCGVRFSDETCETKVSGFDQWVVIPATGHSTKVDKAIAPTCTEPGLTEGSSCSACGMVIIPQIEISAKGHNEVIDAKVAASCGKTGKTEGSHCSTCGEVLVAQEEIPATEHNWGTGLVTTAPTCEEDGVRTFTCSICRETKTEVEAALGHILEYIDAKQPTYSGVGWEAYERCTRFECGYSTYKQIPMLERDEISDYATFMRYFKILEEYANDYVAANPGKDPAMLVIKYIRTGVDRYNSGSWNIMAGYEDLDFAEYVKEREDEYNSSMASVDDMIQVTSLKNIKNFTLPNGDYTDIGHMFGTMDISYTNVNSVNHADVAGWTGDLVDLLSLADQFGVTGTLDEMMAEIKETYFLKDPSTFPEEPIEGSFSKTDLYGDLDGFYVMQQLTAEDYEAGRLYEILSTYFTENLTLEDRADYLLKNRLGGVSNRGAIRDAVYSAYIQNQVITTLEGTREFTTENLAELRKASCYVFADYLCELAGDYVEENENIYFSQFSSEKSTLAPGITQEINKAYTADGKQIVYYIATADVSSEYVNVYANYNESDPSLGWAMSRVRDQAEAAQSRYGDPESEEYIPNYTVVAAINGGSFDMSTGEAKGLLVMNGVEYQAPDANAFFAILKDGTAMIGAKEEYYELKAQGLIMEGIAGYGATLVKDGKIVVSHSDTYTSDRASRTAIGITRTGKVVFMVLDGRQEPVSCGASMQEIAQIMLEAGCVHAINMDGGGSTTYLAKQEGEDTISLVSKPSDGYERSVGASLIMVSTAPSSMEFDHAAISADPAYLTVGAQTQLRAAGISPMGNAVEIPEGTTWQVADETKGSITADGLFIAKALGDVNVDLMLDGVSVGTITLHVVNPDQIYFTRDQIDAVYGVGKELPLKALYKGKEVAFLESDVEFTLNNADAGVVEGFVFTASEEYAKKSVTITASLVGDVDVTASINVSLFDKDAYYFDFDNATGGTRQFAWNREVSNTTTEDNITYSVIDSEENVVITYSFGIDMTQIPMPERIADLTYMLPGADLEGASAWTFLLQLAERISPMSEVRPVITFDSDVEVDYSKLEIVCEYFLLAEDGVEFDEETNTLTLRLNWKDQTQAIDPETANPICILNGLKVTPKDGAAWDRKDRLAIANAGEIGYTIYMRANALYSFSQKPENQEIYGLYPYEDGSDRGGYFTDVYHEFEDSYTLDKGLKSGWNYEDGGYAYYVSGERLTGVNKVEGYYYDFGSEGINIGQTKFTGVFEDVGGLRYARAGVIITSGWHTVEETVYHCHEDGFAHVANVNNPTTCIKGGRLTYTCLNCGTRETVGNYVMPNGHDWNEDYVCKKCGTVGKNIADAEINYGSIENPRTSTTIPTYYYRESGVRPSFYVTFDGTTALTWSNGASLNEDGTMRDLYVSWTNFRGVGKAYMELTGKGDYYGTYRLEYYIVPRDVTNFEVSATTSDSITLVWDAAAGADYYRLYAYSNGSRKLIANIEGTSYTVTGLGEGKTYSFQMISSAHSTDGENLIYNCAKWSDVVTAQTEVATTPDDGGDTPSGGDDGGNTGSGESGDSGSGGESGGGATGGGSIPSGGGSDIGGGAESGNETGDGVEVEDDVIELENPFIDVPDDAYYTDAVLWAVEVGVTTGKTPVTFCPQETCTRAQAVTFLWRAAGSPDPESTEMPFIDIPETAYYYKAVLWAIEQGITKGTTQTTFSPNDECSRAHIVTFLWRAHEAPLVDAEHPFVDVHDSAYYTDSVLWAVMEGITNGTTTTTFSPGHDCTRAQIVTFLYRYMIG